MSYRLDGFIVANDDEKEYYNLFGLTASTPIDIDKWLKSDDSDKTLYINSFGGDIFAGSRMYTAVKEHGSVDIVVDGLAASAASIVMCAGRNVKISPTAQIMIHNVQMGSSGDYRDMIHAAEELKTANDGLINAYRIKTGLPDGQLQNYMDNETWFDAKKAKELGFVDEILFTGEQGLSTLPDSSTMTAQMQLRHKVAMMNYFPKFIDGFKSTKAEEPRKINKSNNEAYNNGLFLLQSQINKNNLRRVSK